MFLHFNRRFKIYLIAFLILAIAGSLTWLVLRQKSGADEATTQTNSISGLIIEKDTDEPIVNAQLDLHLPTSVRGRTPDIPITLYSSQQGTFNYDNLDLADDYRLTIVKISDQLINKDITFSANGKKFLSIAVNQDETFSYDITRTDKTKIFGQILSASNSNINYSKTAISISNKVGSIDNNGFYSFENIDPIIFNKDENLTIWNTATNERYYSVLSSQMNNDIQAGIFQNNVYVKKESENNTTQATQPITLSGTVTSQSQQVKSAIISLVLCDFLGEIVLTETITDQQGRYELIIEQEYVDIISNLLTKPGATDKPLLSLFIQNELYEDYEFDITKSFANNVYNYDINLTLKQFDNRIISGSLSDISGVPIIGRPVLLVKDSKVLDSTTSKSAGNFALEKNLPAGDYDLSVIYAKESNGELINQIDSLKNFTIVDSQTKCDLGNLVFDLSKDESIKQNRPSITGHIVNTEKPVSATIKWVENLIITQSDEDGYFEFNYGLFDDSLLQETNNLEIQLFGYKKKIIPFDPKLLSKDRTLNLGDINLDEIDDDSYALKLLLFDNYTKLPILIGPETGTLLRVDDKLVSDSSTPNSGYFTGHQTDTSNNDPDLNSVLLKLAPGSHTIKVKVENYDPKTITVQAEANKTDFMNMDLDWAQRSNETNCKNIKQIYFCFFGDQAAVMMNDSNIDVYLNKIANKIIILRTLVNAPLIPEAVIIETSKRTNASAISAPFGHNSIRNTMTFYQPIFYKSIWQDNIENITTHEFGHLYDFGVKNQQISANRNFVNKYNIVKYRRDFLYWITDSTYTGIGGHPSDNVMELFASDFHSYINHHDRFINNIQQLSHLPQTQNYLIFNYKFIRYFIDQASDNDFDFPGTNPNQDPFPCGNIFASPYFDANKDDVWESSEILAGDFLKCSQQATLQGRTIDANGTLLSGVKVEVIDKPDAQQAISTANYIKEDLNYIIPDISLASGLTEETVLAKASKAGCSDSIFPVILKIGQTIRQDFQLNCALSDKTITGTITDAVSGSNINNALVTVDLPSPIPDIGAITDSNGLYYLRIPMDALVNSNFKITVIKSSAIKDRIITWGGADVQASIQLPPPSSRSVDNNPPHITELTYQKIGPNVFFNFKAQDKEDDDAKLKYSWKTYSGAWSSWTSANWAFYKLADLTTNPIVFSVKAMDTSTDRRYSLVQEIKLPNQELTGQLTAPTSFSAGYFSQKGSKFFPQSHDIDNSLIMNAYDSTSASYLIYKVNFGSTSKLYQLIVTGKNGGHYPKDGTTLDFDIYIDTDGTGQTWNKQAVLIYKASRDQYVTGGVDLGLLSGIHNLKLVWKNDQSKANKYDNNAAIKQLVIQERTTPITFQASNYSQKGSKFFPQIHFIDNSLVMNAYDSTSASYLIYKVYFGNTDKIWQLVVTGANGGHYPKDKSTLDFKVYVDTDGTGTSWTQKGVLAYKASRDQYVRGRQNLGQIQGIHNIKVLWINDQFKAGAYDNNALVKELLIEERVSPATYQVPFTTNAINYHSVGIDFYQRPSVLIDDAQVMVAYSSISASYVMYKTNFGIDTTKRRTLTLTGSNAGNYPKPSSNIEFDVYIDASGHNDHWKKYGRIGFKAESGTYNHGSLNLGKIAGSHMIKLLYVNDQYKAGEYDNNALIKTIKVE